MCVVEPVVRATDEGSSMGGGREVVVERGWRVDAWEESGRVEGSLRREQKAMIRASNAGKTEENIYHQLHWRSARPSTSATLTSCFITHPRKECNLILTGLILCDPTKQRISCGIQQDLSGKFYLRGRGHETLFEHIL